MSTCFPKPDVAGTTIDNRRLTVLLRHALEIDYAHFLEVAEKKWKRNLAGSDPSDACVSVRVSSGEPQKLSVPCAGVSRKHDRSPLNSNGHPLLV